MIGKPVGWIVKVSYPGRDLEDQQYYVAEPVKTQAVAGVRRRVPGAEGATVEAVQALSRSQMTKLRLMRGDMMPVK